MTLLRALPKEVQRQARKAYERFQRDPYHPSLQFKRVKRKQNLYSVRINREYRALGIREADDLIVWIWIGLHSEYDDLLSR